MLYYYHTFTPYSWLKASHLPLPLMYFFREAHTYYSFYQPLYGLYQNSSCTFLLLSSISSDVGWAILLSASISSIYTAYKYTKHDSINVKTYSFFISASSLLLISWRGKINLFRHLWPITKKSNANLYFRRMRYCLITHIDITNNNFTAFIVIFLLVVGQWTVRHLTSPQTIMPKLKFL